MDMIQNGDHQSVKQETLSPRLPTHTNNTPVFSSQDLNDKLNNLIEEAEVEGESELNIKIQALKKSNNEGTIIFINNIFNLLL